MVRIMQITALLVLFTTINQVFAQKKGPQFDVSVDPIAFFLNGVSVHGGYQTNGWHFDLEGFTLETPASLHGNEGFTASQTGLELKVDHYFKGFADGFFVSAGGGFSNLKVTYDENGKSKEHIEFSAGFRSGYRWNTGLGNLYLTPLAGLEVNLNARDLEINGNTFETGVMQPYLTANVGWYF